MITTRIVLSSVFHAALSVVGFLVANHYMGFHMVRDAATAATVTAKTPPPLLSKEWDKEQCEAQRKLDEQV